MRGELGPIEEIQREAELQPLTEKLKLLEDRKIALEAMLRAANEMGTLKEYKRTGGREITAEEAGEMLLAPEELERKIQEVDKEIAGLKEEIEEKKTV